MRRHIYTYYIFFTQCNVFRQFLCVAFLVCILLLLILDTSRESNGSVSIVSEYDSQTETLKRVFLEFNASVSV